MQHVGIRTLKFFKREYRYSLRFCTIKIISVEDYREMRAVVDVDNDDKLVQKIDIPTFES
jgi:hypothetical protein